MKLLAKLSEREFLHCLMDGEIKISKLTLAKIPIVLICLALWCIDISSGDVKSQDIVPLDTALYHGLLGLHLLVFLDLVWKNLAFSMGYYSVLTLYVAWSLIGGAEGSLLLKYGLFLLPLAPYIWVSWVVWRKGQSIAQKKVETLS